MTPMLWGIVAFLAIGLVTGLYFIYRYVKSDEEEETPEYDGGTTMQVVGPDGHTTLSETLATTTEEYRGARKSRMIALKESLEASLETRHGAADASAKDRLSMPWFMLIGGEASGKTTLLANTGLPLPYGPAFEVDSKRKDAGRWWLYEDAVVLEAPAALPGATATATTLVPDQTQPVSTSEGWNTLLHMLSRERPDSPLNGIIVTVSAQDLLAARVDPDKLTDQVERIRVFLEKTRKVLGVRLPLHLLVTKCDTLAGFKSFANNLPSVRRNDIFGWSNPNKVEAPFNPDWVDLGLAAVKTHLEDLRDELLAAPDEIVDADGLFVFVNEFGELHEPLKDFVTRLFDGNERRPNLFLRGFYFCGDAIESVSEAELADLKTSGARATMQISSEAVLGGQTRGHNLVFLKSLFQEKIFREAGLAKPVQRFRLSRDRRVVLAQAAALVFLLIGGGGLWTALNGYRAGGTLNPGLRHDAEAVTAMLAGMAIDIDEVKRGTGGPDSAYDRRLRDAAVIELVSEMRNVETIRKSPFIPATWFSPLPSDIRRSMIAGIESIVLPVSRQRLQERIDRLVSDTAAVADVRALTEYLSEVKALSRHIAMYNTLATRDSGTVPQLATMLDYLFGERPLEGDSTYTSEDFQMALRQASAARIALTPEMVRSVLARSVGLVASVARSASQQLVARTSAAAERAVDPAEDIEALRGLRALVDLSDPGTGLVASISDSAIFGIRLARVVEDSIGVELRAAGLRLWRDSLSPADAERRLRDMIAQLFQLRFMERASGLNVVAEMEPRQRLRWDVGRLELVQAMRGEFDRALYVAATSFPGQNTDRLRRGFETQLRARAVDAAANAQRLTPMVGADSAAEVKASAANLELAAPRILRTARLLDSLGAREDGRRLIAAASRQADQALAITQALFDRGRYFVPNTTAMLMWQGQNLVPLNTAAIGLTQPDTFRLNATLVQQVNAISSLSQDVMPAIRFLRRPQADSSRVPRLLADWETVGVAVERWRAGETTTSTLAQLHAFIRDDMGTRDVQSCASAVAGLDTGRTTDILVIRRRHYRMAMAGRCGEAGEAAVTMYQRLRSTFASRVAGRFPFADTAQAGAPDADVAGVREVLRQYDHFVNNGWHMALRTDPRLQVAVRPAVDFLDAMERARAFLAPVMDNERRPPQYFLMIGEGELERPEDWVYGRAVTVYAETADSTGLRAEVVVTGPWAAIKAARRAGVERVRLFHPDTKGELPIPIFPSVAPDIRR